jgi:hypothetical protein
MYNDFNTQKVFIWKQIVVCFAKQIYNFLHVSKQDKLEFIERVRDCEWIVIKAQRRTAWGKAWAWAYGMGYPKGCKTAAGNSLSRKVVSGVAAGIGHGGP